MTHYHISFPIDDESMLLSRRDKRSLQSDCRTEEASFCFQQSLFSLGNSSSRNFVRQVGHGKK